MYTIKDVALMSGLTDRTLRNYLKMGILVGEKKDGIWYFTDEQVQDFMQNRYARAAIEAGRNAVLYDFLQSYDMQENTACIVLHLPKEKPLAVSSFFCRAVCNRKGVKMTFDHDKGRNKVILVGSLQTVHEIIREFYSQKDK